MTLHVTLRLIKENPAESFIVTTRDVSTGGMFVFTDRPMAVDEIVEVELATLSTWEPLTLRAKVCRVSTEGEEESGAGLKFIDLTDSDLVALINLTTSLDFES